MDGRGGFGGGGGFQVQLPVGSQRSGCIRVHKKKSRFLFTWSNSTSSWLLNIGPDAGSQSGSSLWESVFFCIPCSALNVVLLSYCWRSCGVSSGALGPVGQLNFAPTLDLLNNVLCLADGKYNPSGYIWAVLTLPRIIRSQLLLRLDSRLRTELETGEPSALAATLSR